MKTEETERRKADLHETLRCADFLSNLDSRSEDEIITYDEVGLRLKLGER